MKHHIQEQVKAQKLAKSKFTQSKVTQVSSLHIAASQNQFELVEKLLANGADPNAEAFSTHTCANEDETQVMRVVLLALAGSGVSQCSTRARRCGDH